MATSGTISSAGIGSGLDVNSIVSKLMALEQGPLTRLQDKISSYEAKISALGGIKSSLSSMQSAISGLAFGSSFQATTVSSSDTSIVQASVSSGGIPGNHSITVSKLAQSQTLVATRQADTTTAIGSGTSTTLTIDLGTTSGSTFTTNGSGPYTVTIDSTNNSLGGIRDAINAANTGVTASIVNDGNATNPYRLVLSSASTGADQSMQIKVSGDATLSTLLTYDPVTTTKNLTETVTAQDASFSVDGLAITKSSNTVTDVINGVTLNLTGAAPLTPVTVSVAQDTNSIKDSINAFVKNYNDLVQQIKTQTDSGVSSGKAGALASDSLTRYIESSINAEINTAPTSVTGSYKSLTDIGITFQQDGTLAVDDATLTTALQSDSANVQQLFSATDGYGTRLYSVLSGLANVGGTIDSRTTSYNSYIQDLNNQTVSVQSSLADTEKRLRAQFTSLDVLVGQMNVTSNYLTSALAGLGNIKTG